MDNDFSNLKHRLEEAAKALIEEETRKIKSEQNTKGKDGFMRVITIAEAARIYKMSRWTLHRLRKAGKIKAYKKERKVLLDQDSLENFIKSAEEKYEFAG